jgi:Protein of unknown function (DUF1194)
MTPILRAVSRTLVAGALVVALASWTLSRLALAGDAAPLDTSPIAGTQVDTALVVSVDVSNSVDDVRYKLQMEGIASALEDPSVVDAILTGPNASILLSLVTWADKPKISIPWVKIGSKDEAAEVARRIRKLPKEGGEFTCVSGMLRTIADKVVTQIPMKANRVVVDVSGDGKDNCNREETPEAVRDELVSSEVIINGLPILEGGDKDSLETWYRDHVMGGTGAFVLPANGFGDFGRAIRQKFVIEISGQPSMPANLSAAEAPTSEPRTIR